MFLPSQGFWRRLVPILGPRYHELVKILPRANLREFWEREDCRDSKQPLLAWFKGVQKTEWKTPADVTTVGLSARRGTSKKGT